MKGLLLAEVVVSTRKVVAAVSIACGVVGTVGLVEAAAQSSTAEPAVINLMTDEGVAQVKGRWLFSEVKIIEVSSKPTDEDLTKLLTDNPKGRPPMYFPQQLPFRERRTYDIEPRAGGADFDDSTWEVLQPNDLTVMRGGGQLCFVWYRIRLTVPERVGAFATVGSKAYITVNVDDMQEVWVDGKMQRGYGKPTPNLINGMNMPTRVLLAESVKPGQTIQVAVYGINGILSAPSSTRIFIREARVDFVR